MKTRLAVNLVLFFLVLLSGSSKDICMAQTAMSPAEKTLLTKAQEAIATDNSANIQQLEPNAINSARSSAARDGDRLLLYMESGESKTYTNRPECKIESKESACQKFSLVGYIRSQHLFIVAQLDYENAEYIIVDDRTGNESIFRAFPELSSSGQYAVVILENDEQVGFGLQIWRREGTQFVLDWSGSPFISGIYTTYKLLQWPKDALLKFEVVNSFAPPEKDAVNYFEVEHSADGWHSVMKSSF